MSFYNKAVPEKESLTTMPHSDVAKFGQRTETHLINIKI
ncbi:hypothetical protein D088_790038 [Salmonella enterica subsp. houtenae serovar 16:z4,z32:-- str. RKS3027]|nr:hypothetical protein D088_790038 [Salmonella enterica subsp. houtenae serovar 16:z4,z32:-- str. RKS3027]